MKPIEMKLMAPMSSVYSPDSPRLVVHQGKRGYIWIGDASGACFAVLSGRKTLLKLAKAILTATRTSGPRT